MMNRQSAIRPTSASQRSLLLPIGIVLILLGILVPRPMGDLARGMDSNLRSIALILSDGFRLCFFGGVVCVVIALLRQRKRRT